MIFSSKAKFIFCHIHKCGGESIEYEFDRVSHVSDLIIGAGEKKYNEVIQKRYVEKFYLRKHSRTDKIIRSFNHLIDTEYVVYIIIRNPLDRALSTYYYFKQWKYKCVQPFSNPSDFWISLDDHDNGFDEFFTPQSSFLPSIDINKKIYTLQNMDKLINAMNDRIDSYDYFGKMKNIHINKSQYPKNKATLSRAAIKVIKKRYHQDFLLYEKYNS